MLKERSITHILFINVMALYVLWLREVKRTLRDKAQFVGGVSRPILWVIILGIGLNPYFRGEAFGKVSFVVPFTYLQFIFPGVVMLNIFFTSMQSAVSVIWDREFGFYREIMIAPISRLTIVLSKILGGATIALIHGCIVLALARFADVSLTLPKIIEVIGFMFLLACALTALGVVIASLVQGFQSFGVFSNAIILPLYFTSSSVFPIDPSLSGAQTRVIYPEWLITIVELNPLTYSVDVLRGILINYTQFGINFGLLVTLSVFCVFLFFAYIRLRRI